jgi:hypothetical protein
MQCPLPHIALEMRWKLCGVKIQLHLNICNFNQIHGMKSAMKKYPIMTEISGRGFLGLPQDGVSYHKPVSILLRTVGAQCQFIF